MATWGGMKPHSGCQISVLGLRITIMVIIDDYILVFSLIE